MMDKRTADLVIELNNYRQAQQAKELRERGEPYLQSVCSQIAEHPENIRTADDEAPLFV